MPNIMSHNHNTRLTSTKYPCGACAGECKDGSVACILCNSWYDAGNCSGLPSSILMAMSKTSGLVWLCKSCETKGMERLLKDEKQIDAKAQETIVAKVMEDKLDEIRDTNTKLINCHFSNKTLKLNLKTYFQKTEKAHRAGPKLPNGMLPW